MVLPVTGSLPVHGRLPGSIAGSKPKRAIIVKLPDEIVQALIARREANSTDPPLDIEFGSHSGIHIGNNSFPARLVAEGSEQRPLEIYSLTSNKTQAPLKHYASVEGKLLVNRVLDDEISKRVKKSSEVSEQRAKARPVKILETPPTQKGTSKSQPKEKKGPSTRPPPIHVRNESLGSRGVTSTAARLSPIPPPTPTPKAAVSEALVNMRIRLIHYLAITPSPSVDIISTIGGEGKTDATTRSNISTLLSQVAIEDHPPKRSETKPLPRLWRLKAESWLDVRPYEYPDLKDEERKRLGMLARQTLKNLGIPETDPRWEHVKYRSSSSNPLTLSNGRTQRPAREPSPLPPPVKPRPKPPNSRSAARPSKSSGSLPDSPPAAEVAKPSKELASRKVERVKASPSIRQPDVGAKLHADTTRPSSTSRLNGKRDREQDFENDILNYSETKKRKSSDEDSIAPSRAMNKSTNGTRTSLQANASSKLSNHHTPPSTSKAQKLNGSTSSRRRKSPIYTSTSEEEDEYVAKRLRNTNGTPPHRPPKRTPSPLPPNGRSKRLPYSMPKIALGEGLPKDHVSLRKRYNAIYPSYIAVYQKRAEQRMAIEKMLDDSVPAEEGEVEEGLAVGSDVEMMDASDLERMNADLTRLENELSRINAALQSTPS